MCTVDKAVIVTAALSLFFPCRIYLFVVLCLSDKLFLTEYGYMIYSMLLLVVGAARRVSV